MNKMVCLAFAAVFCATAPGWSVDFDQGVSVSDMLEQVRTQPELAPPVSTQAADLDSAAGITVPWPEKAVTTNIQCTEKGNPGRDGIKLSGWVNNRQAKLRVSGEEIYHITVDGETAMFVRYMRQNEPQYSFAKYVSDDSLWFYFTLSIPKNALGANNEWFRAYFTFQHDEVGGPGGVELDCKSWVK